jgi:hypothetical protein
LKSRDQDEEAEVIKDQEDLTGVISLPPGETLNLRDANDTGASILGALNNGIQVKILDEDGKWTKVSIEGHVAGRYVR